MESANLHYQHHHQEQEQQVVDQSSSPPPLATHSSSSSFRAAAWTPNTILNNSYFNPNINATSMIQDMGFRTSFSSMSAHELQLARIKQELSSSYISNYPKFTATLNSHSSSSSIELDSHLLHPSSSSSSSYIQNDRQRDLLKTFSSGCQINGLHQLPAARGTFSQIFPTINISNFNQSASNSVVSSASSFDMNLEALDLFNSVRFSGSLSSQPSQDYLGLLKSSLPYSLDNIQQQSRHRPSNSSPTHAISPFHNGIPEVKRSSSFLETKAPQATPKKSRLDSRSSSPPFKVRKEKLGDRIASLQQLVAPFGKTDTASVLMEAIGYIKFLQSQVETLSVPYMKSSRNKTRKMQGGSEEYGEEEASRRDLRSRGLCLVPLTGVVGVWSPAGP